MRVRALLAVVLSGGIATGFAAPCARAEDTPPKKPKPKEGGGFRFTPPDDGKPSATPAAPPAAAAAAPKDPIEVAIRGLSTWPGQDGVKAAERLMLDGPAAVQPLRRALADPQRTSSWPGAAWVLGKIGEPVDVPILLRAAAESTSGARLETFFEASYELDVKVTKKWLFGYLDLERPTFRARAAEFLAGLVTAEDRPRIDGLLSARKPGVRLAGLELLSRTGAPDATDRLVDALSDANPDVARGASRLLAQGTETVLPRLNLLAREGDPRQRAYAALALVEYGRRVRKSVIEPATLMDLAGRRGLLHPDKLSRGAAAVALAFGGIESKEKSLVPLLDGPVVDVLIDTVQGDHFLDFGTLVEPVFAALRRLSGLDFSPSAGPWLQWWLENRGSFHARRALEKLEPEDVAKARVVFDVVDPDGRRRRVTFTAIGGENVPGAMRIPGAAFQALVTALEDAGIFSGADDSRALADEHVAVRVGVMNQERRMVLVPSGEDGRYALLRARLDALEEQNAWQRYRDLQEFPDADAWWRTQSAFFSTASADGRRERLSHMVVASFDDLTTDAARAEALDLLDRLGAELSDEEALALLSVATRATAIGPVEARVIERIAALGRPALADPLLDALSASGAPAAKRILATTLANAGVVRVRESFADPRPGVRAAGTSAAVELIAATGGDPSIRKRVSDVLEGGLKSLLVDPDPLVKVGAAGALALLGAPDMLPVLESLYRDGPGVVKIAVAEALGRIGGSEVHPLLVRIVAEEGRDSGPVRAAALEAMAASHHPDAVRLLVFYLLKDKDEGVQQAAEAALVSLGSEDAMNALVEQLNQGTLEPARSVRAVRVLGKFEGSLVRETLGRWLESGDPGITDQAALGLARQNEGVAVPYLIAILRRPEEPLRPQALEALQGVTSLVLLVNGYEAAADQYEAWFRTHKDQGDRAWFRDALAKRGYDVAGLAGFVRGDADLTAVPVLLKALRDDDRVLRRNANLALRRVTGRTFGAVERDTAPDVVRRIADRWAAWWRDSAPLPK